MSTSTQVELTALLSFAQQRLWFLEQLDPGLPIYHIPLLVDIAGAFDVQVLTRCLEEIVERHEALRTTFAKEDETPIQLVHSVMEVPVQVIDLRGRPEAEREAACRAGVQAAVQAPFDLQNGPLLRVIVWQTATDRFSMLIVMHHIITDGWSMGILMQEVVALYTAFRQGLPSPLPELEIQYADFAEWQLEHLQGEKLQRQLTYWKEQLGGELPVLQLPTDRPHPARKTGAGQKEYFVIGETLSARLKEICMQEGVTLFMLLLAAYQTLLFRYSGQTDLTVGSPIAGRNLKQLENLVGFFVNTLVLRADLSGAPSFKNLLQQVRKVCLDAYAHQELPYEKLVAELVPDRSSGRSPLFQAFFVLQNVPLQTLELPGVTMNFRQLEQETAMFDLSLSMKETDGELHGELEYSTELFDRATMQRMKMHFATLLESIAADPGQSIRELRVMPLQESQQLLGAWKGSAALEQEERLLHELVAAQASRTPDAVAVVCGEERLTYQELDVLAERLARFLQAQGIGPEQRVGLCVERSTEMIVGMLGILKAGGAYLPLDPHYPQERIAYMLEDSQAGLVLTQEHLKDRLPDKVRAIALDQEAEWASSAAAGLIQRGTATTTCYVIYTSGSTGTPKGVLVPHRAVVNHNRAVRAEYELSASDRVLQFSSVSFDIAVEEIFPTLLTGAALVLRGREQVPGVQDLLQLVTDHGVTVLNLPTAYWHGLVQELAQAGVQLPPSVRLMIVGGEKPSAELYAQWKRLVPPTVRWINAYGPTEAAVTATLFDPGDTSPESFAFGLPIGRPIAGTTVYVLSDAQQPVPIGVPGELYIGGAGLATGYLGRPDLTAEKFVQVAATGGERLYRTGDRVRFLPDGNLLFAGRLDDQVKVRGFRIEPGEIEAVLAQHDAVADVLVLVREDVPNDPRLVAYVVPQGGKAPDLGELRRSAAESLPGYMVPSVFVLLDSMPLTPNGKVDRKNLPRPDASDTRSERPYTAPATDAEQKIAEIWAEVLHLDQVGADDHFFEIGGHSLLATQVMSRIERAFGVRLPLRRMFDTPTPAGLAALLEAQSDQADKIPRTSRLQQLPLSYGQQSLWLTDRLMPNSSAYNMPFAVRLQGALDVPALEKSVNEIISRHESLRTIFAEADGEPVQVLREHSWQTLAQQDLQSVPADEREAQMMELAQQEMNRPFDLSTGPLLRCKLFALEQGEWVLVFCMHHIISDGWSIGLLIGELTAAYRAFAAGRTPQLPELPIQYADYAVWQKQELQGERLARQLDYWKAKLAGPLPVLQLPTDHPHPAVQTHNGNTLRFALSAELLGKLNALAKQADATLFMTLLAAYNVLLHRYAGQDDILVGVPSAGRTREETEGLIGFFVNTLVMRTDLSGDPPFRELLARVKETSLDAEAHQDVPFELLVSELQPERSTSHSALFQVMFALQNTPQTRVETEGLTFSGLGLAGETAKFDLTLTMEEGADGLYGTFEYNVDLFEEATVERMIGHLRQLLQAATEQPDTAIGSLPLLTAAEREQVLTAWSQHDVSCPQLPVHVLIEQQAVKTPHKTAVAFENIALTYADLNAQANRLARLLQKKGVGAGQMVGVAMERSPELIVALLAIWKAGGAYVPLDVQYPAERLTYLLEDTGVRVIVTHERLQGKLPPHTAELLVAERLHEELAAKSRENLPCLTTPDSLAYVMYTSGSTGQPKGVLTPHRGIVRLIAPSDFIPWQEDDAVLQYSPVAFDASTLEIWGPLVHGAKLVLFPPYKASTRELGQFLTQQGITVLFLTTGFFLQMVEDCLDELSGLRVLMAGGEAMSMPHAKRVIGSMRGRFVHAYGPTEATTFATVHVATPQDALAHNLPIGRPVAGTSVYVLDAHMQPVPVGVPGELHIGGAGLALGYFNRPDLTEEKFVPHPFEEGELLYKTGDAVRWLADGRLEFSGRLDSQVKIRGFRIELGEVEAVIDQHPAVLQSAVLARADAVGVKRLVAYLVLADPSADIRSYLKAKLPDYMVPSAFVTLDRLPLNPNGKVDTRALPTPTDRAEGEADWVAPRNPVEEKLASLFAELLEIDPVGIHDHFFERGGHSLLGTRLISRLRAEFRTELPLRALFEHPTVAELALLVGGADTRLASDALPPLVKADRSVNIPLSYPQLRVWEFEQKHPGSNAYNIATAMRIHGALDAEAMAQSIQEIVRRHEALRTTFRVVDGQPVQIIAPQREHELKRIDLSTSANREAELSQLVRDDAFQAFDLATGPLLRTTLVRFGEAEHALLLNMHHIISDGWSRSVFVREFLTLYEAYTQGKSSPLSDLPVQFADYAIWQRGWMQGETLEQQLSYWKTKLRDLPQLHLPTDPTPLTNAALGAKCTLSLSAQLTERVKQVSREAGASPFMTLLTAFKLIMQELSGQDDIVVGTPAAGRRLEETEAMIGMFLNTLVLRTDLSGNPDFRELLGRVRETALEAFAQQEMPFIKLAEELQPVTPPERSPLFDVMVNYLNTPESALQLPGLTLSDLQADEEQTSKFWMTLYIRDFEGQFHLTLVYQPQRFSLERMEVLLTRLRAVLEQNV
ncbi:amino acid adenylation domain-containing protein [Tumebacillus sp. BK434]|uniref:amino acid adenylation domain-containing protein n=1 Tax=Tumebacillus sp. BK434 TaxID=2512169 RepID=UPI0010522999|nr:non-ribosomal peptide synthetase [Tumebacillus sp. BK434]TCP59296.1 amino acid adenylation domain-containing protein [Tumebacillus sp. BK434]